MNINMDNSSTLSGVRLTSNSARRVLEFKGSFGLLITLNTSPS